MTRPTHYRHEIPAHVMLQRAHRPLTEEEKGNQWRGQSAEKKYAHQRETTVSSNVSL